MREVNDKEFNESYDDELDLYEIVEILVKRKKIILITFFTIFLIGLCGGIYLKEKTPNYIVRDIIINQEDYNVDGVNQVLPKNMYLLNRRVERFFQISELIDIYNNTVDEKNRNIESKRDFLENLITVQEGKNRYSIKVKELKNSEISKEVLNQYVYNLRKMDNLPERVAEEKKIYNDKLVNLDKELSTITKEMEVIFKSDKNLINMKPEEQVSYMSYRYPGLFLRRKEIVKYYDYYTDKLIDLSKIGNNDTMIRVISDSYVEEGKNKSKLIVVVGAILGLFLGVMLAFLKEFIDGYKKRYKK